MGFGASGLGFRAWGWKTRVLGFDWQATFISCIKIAASSPFCDYKGQHQQKSSVRKDDKIPEPKLYYTGVKNHQYFGCRFLIV